MDTPTPSIPAPIDAPPPRVGGGAAARDPDPPHAEAPPRARGGVRGHWKLLDLADPVELAVAELCTNAVRHGGGLAGLELVLGASREFVPPVLRVMVSDHDPDHTPELTADNDALSESGRGLHLVTALSRRWGWYRTGFDEKQVWCTFVIV